LRLASSFWFSSFSFLYPTMFHNIINISIFIIHL
jgi:hypothetical protein